MLLHNFFRTVVIFTGMLIGLLTVLTANTSHAAVDATSIRESVDSFMNDHLLSLTQRYGETVTTDYTIGALDNRLNMPNCSAPLKVELKGAAKVGHTNVRVSCQHGSPWSLYVPLTINLYRPVVTTISPISKGAKITAGQVKLSKMDISTLRGSYYTDLGDVLGLQAKRSLRVDSIVLASLLEPPLLIKRGDSVVVTASSGSLVVRINGTALKDGHAGEQITVRNKQSKRIVEAHVTGPGKVSVTM